MVRCCLSLPQASSTDNPKQITVMEPENYDQTRKKQQTASDTPNNALGLRGLAVDLSQELHVVSGGHDHKDMVSSPSS